MFYLVTVTIILVGVHSSVSQQVQQPHGCVLLDMSYDFANDTMVWPTTRKFEIQNRTAKENPKGIWVANENFCSPEHGGTHMDAPFHFYKDGWTIDRIPTERLIASAAVVDISSEANSNSDAQLTVKHLLEWEEINGRLPNSGVVIMNSGWGKRWGNITTYFGNAEGDTSKFHFPGFHPDAAQWLIDNRGIVGIGVDTGSVDFGATRDFQTHITLAKNNVFLLENVANADKLPPAGATLMMFPMKIRSGTGGPCRIIAQICNSSNMAFNSGASHVVALLVLVGLFLNHFSAS